MIRLVRTSLCCPEQYDAYLDGKPVGYLRLRNGEFSVDYPQCNGETIYTACPAGDGEFSTAAERDYFLRFAVDAIERKLRGETVPAPAPDVKYEIAEP